MGTGVDKGLEAQTDLRLCRQLIWPRSRGKRVFLINGAGTVGYIHGEKKRNPILASCCPHTVPDGYINVNGESKIIKLQEDSMTA